ncbi:MAG TPA: hypothetical protein P5077_07020 [bacterium]|nr:hypothetical protein [bacterium]
MKNRLVGKLLDRMPIPDELRDIIGDQLDLSAIISREVATQLLEHGGRMKQEAKAILARELAGFLEKIDVDKALTSALENLELDIRIGFRRRKPEQAAPRKGRKR